MVESVKQGLSRRAGGGLAVATLVHGGVTELFITAIPDGDSMHSMFEKAWGAVSDAGAVVMRQDVFGIPAERDEGPAALRDVCGNVDWPVAWLEEGASQGESLTGTHIQAVAGAPVRRIEIDGDVIGSVFDNSVATFCRLGGVCSTDAGAPRVAQARQVFERIEKALGAAGMSFADVVRTWYYVDHILDWYGDFNAARSRFFEERGVFGGLLPASTGVGGGNRSGAAVLADVLAVRKTGAGSPLAVREIESPLQCPAMQYRSSFSRAVEIDAGDHRRLLVSGTAGIERDGRTGRVGDVRGQVDLTIDVVAAILESRGMSWDDVTRAIAYVKHGADAAVYRERAAMRGLSAMPQVVAENDICRPDLLFEMEVDAIQSVLVPDGAVS